MSIVDTIVSLYAFTPSDTAALEATLYEQLRLSYLERLVSLGRQHGIANPLPVLQGEQMLQLQQKAHDDALSITATHNRELRNQVEAIYRRNPQADRGEYIRVLSSWGRDRSEYKAIQIALATLLWAVQYGLELFITRNNLFNQIFRAVHGTPVCQICIRIVAAGIVPYRYVQENPLPAHIGCYGEWVTIDATDLTQRGGVIWLGI